MHRKIILAACWLLPVVGAMGLESELEGFEDQPLLSIAFRQELVAADQASDVHQLEALYQKYKLPAEQAEIELTLARIYCQRTGRVDPAESIKWYDKALVRDLPLTALAKLFILRGNMHERLKHTDDALADYIRGLLVCLHFNIPEQRPDADAPGKLQPPPLNNSVGRNAEEDANARADYQRQYAEYRREHDMIRREQDLVAFRYYYVDAITRVLEQGKLKESDLRAIAEKLTNRKDRLEEILRRVRAPNPNPFH